MLSRCRIPALCFIVSFSVLPPALPSTTAGSEFWTHHAIVARGRAGSVGNKYKYKYKHLTNPVVKRRAAQPPPSPLNQWFQRHAVWSAVMITTAKTVAADLFTQLVLQSSPEASYNPKRTLLFALFGCFFQGYTQYHVVNGVWERLFPGSSAKNVVSKIVGMNLISDPLLFFPCFYIFKQCLQGGNNLYDIVPTALANYKVHCLEDWRNSWMIWIPGHAITYGIMPPHYRIPWMACLSFFYMCILSLTRGGK